MVPPFPSKTGECRTVKDKSRGKKDKKQGGGGEMGRGNKLLSIWEEGGILRKEEEGNEENVGGFSIRTEK